MSLWSELQKHCFYRWQCALHWGGEQRDLCRVWVGITFYPETPTKIRQLNWELNYFPRSCEKFKCIASKNQHNCPFYLQQTSKIFLNPFILWDMIPAVFMSLLLTIDRDSVSNQYPQPTTQQPKRVSYHVFSSMRTIHSERKRLRVSFAFVHRNNQPDGRVNGTVATYGFGCPSPWLEISFGFRQRPSAKSL